jgi:hypothetical protein
MKTLIKEDNIPYAFHISRKNHIILFPKEQPCTIDIVFKKRILTAEVDDYIADFLIKNNIAEEYNPRYYKKDKTKIIDLIQSDPKLTKREQNMEIVKFAKKLNIWKYGMKKQEMIKKINTMVEKNG